MFLAELICSDGDCELAVEAIGEPEDLDMLLCEDCGCCLQVVSLSAHEAFAPMLRFELARAA
jgi:hypothetical protein